MIAPFSLHYFKTGPESPERKYRIMLARGGIAIANALQEMAANAKTIPAPSRAEIAPGKTYTVGKFKWSNGRCTYVVHLPLSSNFTFPSTWTASTSQPHPACKQVPCEIAPEEGTQKHPLRKQHKSQHLFTDKFTVNRSSLGIFASFSVIGTLCDTFTYLRQRMELVPAASCTLNCMSQLYS